MNKAAKRLTAAPLPAPGWQSEVYAAITSNQGHVKVGNDTSPEALILHSREFHLDWDNANLVNVMKKYKLRSRLVINRATSDIAWVFAVVEDI